MFVVEDDNSLNRDDDDDDDDEDVTIMTADVCNANFSLAQMFRFL